MDVTKLADGVFDAVREYLSKALAPLADRLKALEDRPLPVLPVAVKGDPGEKGEPGQDGKSVTVADVEPLLESMQARWALDFERRAMDVLQRSLDRMPAPAPGKDGKDGVDGRDAFDLENVTLALDGRTLTLGFARGDLVVERTVKLEGMPIDRGFWKEGMVLEKGDGVTFAGSYWIAQKDTTTKPDTTNPDFRIAVKKGRDGKDGDPGKQGPQGEKGLPGMNGRDLR